MKLPERNDNLNAYNVDMNSLPNRTILLSCAAACFSLLGYGLYAQHVQGLAPCPLCVLQRYAFLMVAMGCVIGAFSQQPKTIRIGAGYGLLAALAGAGTAIHHLWVKANPHTSCGIDPLETALNKIWPAQWLPQMFYADGLCSADHAPILGLNIPQWSLVWFVIFTITLCYVVFSKRI
jgi:disulfide bond formation protein DsbB